MAQQTINTPRDTTLLATNTAIGGVAKDATLQSTNTALANLAKDGTLSGVAKDTTLAATNTALGSLAKDATITATNTALGLLGKDASLQDIKTALLSIVSALSPVASGVGFTNTGTGLVSTDVQGALEELDGRQIAADTSTVEDKNGVAVVDRLVYGQKVTAGSVSPSSPLLHQSDIVDDLVTQDATKPLSARQGALLNSNLTDLNFGTEESITTLFTASGKYTAPAMGYVYGYIRKSANSTAGLIRITSDKMTNSYKYNQNLFTANEYVAVMLPVVRGEILTTSSIIEVAASSSSLSFCPLVKRS